MDYVNPVDEENFFDVFYIAHQLYWVFAMSMVFHVGITIARYVMGGLNNFAIDHFFRYPLPSCSGQNKHSFSQHNMVGMGWLK